MAAGETADGTTDESKNGRRMRSRLVVVCIVSFPLCVLAVLGVLPLLVEGIIVGDDLWHEWTDDGVVRRARVPEVDGLVVRGDRVFFTVKAREPLHVYVFGVDSAGTQWTLFPDPRTGPGNPLPPEREHTLPRASVDDAAVEGTPVSWLWSNAVGPVFYFVYMSPRPIEEAAVLAGRLPVLDPDAPAPGDEARGTTIFKKVRAHLILHKKLKRHRGVSTRRFVVRCDARR